MSFVCPQLLFKSVSAFFQSVLSALSLSWTFTQPVLDLSSVWAPSVLSLSSICPLFVLHLPSVWAPSVLRLSSICPLFFLHLPSFWPPYVLSLSSVCPQSALHMSSVCPQPVLISRFFFCLLKFNSSLSILNTYRSHIVQADLYLSFFFFNIIHRFSYLV
jgi:hypothetical protein